MKLLIKRITRLALLAILVTLPQLAGAHDFEVGGIYYNINGNNAIVTYRGSYFSQYSNEYTGAVNIPSTVTYNGTIYSVTSIGSRAFSSCTGLTSVTIGNSVTSIGGYAFSDCSGLTSVTIPNSVTSIGTDAFQSCTGLTSMIVESGNTKYDSRNNCNAIIETATNTLISGCKNTIIPNSVTSIGYGAFADCDGLTSVTIPNSVTTIGYGAFWDCSGLTEVTIPNSVTTIGECAFSLCFGLTSMVVEDGNTKYDSRNDCNAIIETATNTLISGCKNTIIPNSVTSIGESAFCCCSGLTSVTIPNSVTSIGQSAFSGCSGLTSVTIGNSVTSIGSRAFSSCTGLTSVTIPNSVIEIGDEAFSGCSGLTSLTIPNSVTSIGSWAFVFCSGLTSVTIGNSVTSIGESAFYCCSGLTSVTIGNSVTSIGESAFWDCSGLTSVTIGNSVTSIGQSAFSGCSGLTSVTIPNSVTSIGNGAFSGCSGLTSLTIPYSVTSIGQSAFSECTGLTSVTIGNSVTSIGDYAFSECTGLTSVTIGNSVTSIGDYAFGFCSGLTSVYSKIKNPQTVNYDDDIFSDCPLSQCPLYVPHGKHDIYSTTSPWSAFSNIIEMDPTGDVNDDGTVNVTDYVATARYILELNPQPFYLEECDFDDNGTISVADLVSVAYTALHYEDGAPMLSPGVVMTENTVLAMAADVNGRDGSYEVSVNLSNNVDLTALQMDLDLPAGMTLVDASLSGRASGSHQVAFNQLSNGDYRLLASSPACKSFTGSEGAVLTLTLAGEPSGDGLIRNIELATPRAASYKVDDIELHFTSPTGVENMTAATAARIYSDGSNIIIDSPASGTAQFVLPNGISQTVNVAAGHNVYDAPAKGMIIVKIKEQTNKIFF